MKLAILRSIIGPPGILKCGKTSNCCEILTNATILYSKTQKDTINFRNIKTVLYPVHGNSKKYSKNRIIKPPCMIKFRKLVRKY